MNIQMMQVAFGLFLLVNVFIGLWAGRKVKTMRDYALANQSLGLGVLTISFLATFIDIGYIAFEVAFRSGAKMLLFIPVCVFSLSFLFGRLILPKLRYFEGCYTLGDVTQQLYGKHPSLLASALSVFLSVSIIVVQMAYIGIFSKFIGLRSERMILIVGLAMALLHKYIRSNIKNSCENCLYLSPKF